MHGIFIDKTLVFRTRYRDNDDPDFKGVGGHPYGEKGFGFHFNTNDLKFGVIYNF